MLEVYALCRICKYLQFNVLDSKARLSKDLVYGFSEFPDVTFVSSSAKVVLIEVAALCAAAPSRPDCNYLERHVSNGIPPVQSWRLRANRRRGKYSSSARLGSWNWEPCLCADTRRAWWEKAPRGQARLASFILPSSWRSVLGETFNVVVRGKCLVGKRQSGPCRDLSVALCINSNEDSAGINSKWQVDLVVFYCIDARILYCIGSGMRTARLGT